MPGRNDPLDKKRLSLSAAWSVGTCIVSVAIAVVSSMTTSSAKIEAQEKRISQTEAKIESRDERLFDALSDVNTRLSRIEGSLQEMSKRRR